MQSPTFSTSSKKMDIMNKLSPSFRNKRIPSAQDNYSSGSLLPWNQSSQPNRINSCKKLQSPRNKHSQKKRKRSQNSSQRIDRNQNNQNILQGIQSSQKIGCNCSNPLYLNQLLQLKQQYKQIKQAYQQLITQTIKNRQQLIQYKDENAKLAEENEKYRKESEKIRNKLSFMEQEVQRIRRESYKLLEIEQFKSKKLEESLNQKEEAIRQFMIGEHAIQEAFKKKKDQNGFIGEYSSAGQCTVASNSNSASNNLINISQEQSYTFQAKIQLNKVQKFEYHHNPKPKIQSICIPELTPHKTSNLTDQQYTPHYQRLPAPTYGAGHRQESQSLTLSNQCHQHQKTISNHSQFISISLTSMMQNQSQYRYQLSTKRNTNNSNMIKNIIAQQQQKQNKQNKQNKQKHTSSLNNQDYSSITTNHLYAQYDGIIEDQQDISSINYTNQNQQSDLLPQSNPNLPEKSKKNSKIKNSASGHHLHHHNMKILSGVNINDKINRNNGAKSSNDCNFKKFRKQISKKLQVNLDDKHRELLLQPQNHMPRTPLDRKTSKSQKGSKTRLAPRKEDENYDMKSSKKKMSHK